jgi:hypothetical protein
MREHRPGASTLTRQLGHRGNDGHDRAPGRRTLVEQIGHDPRFAAASPVFRLDRQSEVIPAEEGVEVSQPAQDGANPGTVEVPGGTAELRALGVEPRIEPSDATVPREGDVATAPAAQASSKGPHHIADEDAFNNAHVTSRNKANARQLNRPGVRFDTHVGAVDIPAPEANRAPFPDRRARRVRTARHDPPEHTGRFQPGAAAPPR